VMNRMK